MRVGIEVGGTFTDLVAIGPDGIRVIKVPSVPRAPEEGAFDALLASGIAIASIEDLAHGSTVATNAVLERKGFPTAFVTTDGFRDILALQRHGRSRIYDLEYRKPTPVVTRAASFEVRERILADGTIETPLDVGDASQRLVPALKAGGYEVAAICLINAFVNPAHERALRDILAMALPDLHVTISSDITREFREFERASTTTLSAYVQPVIDRYIQRFRQRLAAEDFRGRFSVMQSNGGRLPAEAMRANAINALLSGPAAGVVGAVRQTGRSGYRNIITLDIGGTSTDVCVVTGGAPQLTQEFQLDGLPIRIPLLDINTIGAGGGSIVWVDEGGMLRVGPRSAGADPGPACYARGGTLPTLTDAHVVRGTVRPEAFLGGRMRIDATAAARALEPIAQRFGLALEAAADSAVALADANIVRAIQLIRQGCGRAWHKDDRGSARRRHYFGLRAHRLGLRAVREHDAPGHGRPNCRRPAARGIPAYAWPGARAHQRKLDPRSSPLLPDSGDALRRPSLRGAGVVRGNGAARPERGGRAQQVWRSPSACVFLRRRSGKTHRVRVLSPGRYRAAREAAAARPVANAAAASPSDPDFRRQGLAGRTIAAPPGARRTDAPPWSGIARGGDLDPLPCGGLDGTL
jgi:hypothetical protein